MEQERQEQQVAHACGGIECADGEEQAEAAAATLAGLSPGLVVGTDDDPARQDRQQGNGDGDAD